jgi:hypothetical protein
MFVSKNLCIFKIRPFFDLLKMRAKNFYQILIPLFLLVYSMAYSQKHSKGQFHLSQNAHQYEIIVRFDPEYLAQKNQTQNQNQTLSALQKLYDFKYSSLHASKSKNNSKKKAHSLDFSNFIKLKTTLPNTLLPQLCSALEARPEVIYCDIVANFPPPKMISSVTTKDWTSSQTYLNPAPIGIDAKWAWSQGIFGQHVTARDIEWAWTQDHEDLDSNQLKVGVLENNEDYAFHGTAVLGQIMAQNNGFGMTGAAYGLDSMVLYSENSDSGRIGTLTKAIDDANEGDVLILEMQAQGCHASGGQGKFGPADYDPTVWDLVNLATEKGIVVVAAAGNGAQDLDNICFEAYRDRGDNGSIIVGAGSADLNPLDFTSYGTKVSLQGLGENVYTLSQGSLQGGDFTVQYSNSFNGTSAATPIVASAVILIQSWAKEHLNRFLTPQKVRSLLIETGTPQFTSSKNIGPLPNVKAAIEQLIIENPTSIRLNSLTQKMSYFWDSEKIQTTNGTEFKYQLFALNGQKVYSSAKVQSGTNWPVEIAGGVYWIEINSGSSREYHKVKIH